MLTPELVISIEPTPSEVQYLEERLSSTPPQQAFRAASGWRSSCGDWGRGCLGQQSKRRADGAAGKCFS